ncbi:REP element-mobilizing transposase RayT [Dysgonomonas alginatilytica]|uniref:REP element-mobilizing transposase RayT n=1 Tax=Dysgonomonas alginatilytica TaxID=1605892 RepID=A0A2V3PWI8_9BACT|nr:transposase [Dysgonomonas alginatilytica]PXV69221.1 REP element-mobilizing transposase RayT [Dysgonomonas alginatilytica]
MDIKNKLTSDIYFVTMTVTNWIDVFTRPDYKHIIIDSLNYCSAKKGLNIHAWVLMTNHLHLLISSEQNISDILRDFKKYTSKQLTQNISENISESRKEWLLNLFGYAASIDKKVKNYKFWQEGNNIQLVYSESYCKQKIDYIHQNPVKAEIVNCPEDYRYSSANDYMGNKGLVEIIII